MVRTICAGPGLPAYWTGECISLVRGLGAILICVPGMVGVCAYQDTPSLVSPVFLMVPSGILAWIRVGITVWDAEFEPKRPARNHEL